MSNFLGKDLALLRTLCLLVTLALTTTWPASAAQQFSSSVPDITAFALPDGSLPIICFGNGAPESDAGGHCDECQLTLVQPLAVAASELAYFLSPASNAQTNGRLTFLGSPRASHAHPVRGPPLS
ncbi:MAG: hypothetical protein ABJM29_00855 [Rhizobiaceae bacterium]